MNEPDLKRFLSLLQAVVNGTPPDAEPFTGMTAGEWEALYQRAAQEGVLAVTFDSVMQLPDDLQPPKRLKLTWAGSVDFIEKKYARLLSTTQELAVRFGEQNIRMLIFKGLSIAQYYSIPAHREFGDLDIYLFGQHKEGDRLLKQWGATLKRFGSKDTGFWYKDILIENHALFVVSYNPVKQVSQGNKQFKALLEKTFKNTGAGEVLFPPPDFMLLHFIYHAAAHFMVERLVWRFFYDWTILLHANKSRWSQAVYDEMLPVGSGLRKVADAMTAICVKYMGLPLDEAPPFEPENAIEKTIMEEMIRPVPPPRYWGKTVFGKLLARYRWLMDNRSRVELIMPGSFKYRVLFYVLYHLGHPSVGIWALRKP